MGPYRANATLVASMLAGKRENQAAAYSMPPGRVLYVRRPIPFQGRSALARVVVPRNP
jgi:hypothetical protein